MYGGEGSWVTESELAELYECLSGQVLRYCAFRLGLRADAEDATAEVFARFIANVDRLHPDRRERWLFTVARNVCTDKLKLQSRETMGEGASEQAVMAEPDSWIDPRIRHAVGLLTQGQQQVVFLRVFEDLPFAEIGRICARPEAAVRMRYHRAVRRLRKSLEGVDPCLQTTFEAE